MISLKDCQKIEIPQGALYLGPSDERSSVGYLELNPHQSLTLHNRPALEIDEQVEGVSDMVIYWPDKDPEIMVLKPGKRIEMPAGTWHIHTNSYDEKSLTYWEFNGDITEIIELIRRGAGEGE